MSVTRLIFIVGDKVRDFHCWWQGSFSLSEKMFVYVVGDKVDYIIIGDKVYPPSPGDAPMYPWVWVEPRLDRKPLNNISCLHNRENILRSNTRLFLGFRISLPLSFSLSLSLSVSLSGISLWYLSPSLWSSL